MIDKYLVEQGFQQFYQDIWKRRSVVDILGTRLDALMYEAYRAAATRFYSEGLQEGKRQAEERAARVRQTVENDPRIRPFTRAEPPGTVITSSNPEGTASAVHIPVIIEGEISLDRNRAIGDFLEDE